MADCNKRKRRRTGNMKYIKEGYSLILVGPKSILYTIDLHGISSDSIDNTDMKLDTINDIIENIPNEAWEG